MRFAGIGCIGLTFLVLINLLAPARARADIGIAARYPGDKNIGSDSNVILADDFESYSSPADLKSKWSIVSNPANLRIATESGNYYAGKKAIEMSLPVSTGETLDECRLKLSPEQPTVYFRAYTKFDPGFNVQGSSHNGMAIRAHYPPGAGVKPPVDGTGFYTADLANNASATPLPGENQPGYHQIYAYWPKQRDIYGDHWFSDGWVRPGGNGLWILNPNDYPNFRAMPKHQPQTGRWYCYEVMLRANDIGKQRRGSVVGV